MRSGGVVTTIGNTEAAVFIPEIWSDNILKAVEANLVFANLVNRQYEGEIRAFGDKVNIPNVSNLAANPKAPGTSVTVQAPTETDSHITIDKHKECSFYLEDITAIQSKTDLRSVYTQKAGYAIAKAIDSDIAALHSLITQSDGDGSTLDIDNLLMGVQYLDLAEAPTLNRSIVLHPTQKKAMLGIDKFIQAGYIGQGGPGFDPSMPLISGQFGEILGCRVFFTSQIVVDGSDHAINMLFQKDALALAIQLSPRVQAQYKQEYLAWLVTVDVLYGVAVLKPEFGAKLVTDGA